MAKAISRHRSGRRHLTSARPTATASTGADQPLNRSFSDAKRAKQDEFYTQYVDIQKEVEAYLEFDPDTFRNRTVCRNCDDPFESNFFKYFAANFNRLGLKRLVCTSYDGSPLAGQMTLFDEYNAGNGKRPSRELPPNLLSYLGYA